MNGKTGRDARDHIARTLGKPSDCFEILMDSHVVEDDDTLDDRDMTVVVRNPRITHVEFRPSAGSTLADLQWSTTRPGALRSFLSWPQELEVRAMGYSERRILNLPGPTLNLQGRSCIFQDRS